MAFLSSSIVIFTLSLLQFINNASALTNVTRHKRSIDEIDVGVYREHMRTQVLLSKNGVVYCGGTYIGDNFILTAAQCVYDPDNPKSPYSTAKITIMAGTYKETNSSFVETIFYREVDRIFTADYREPKAGNDIAILKLHEGFGSDSGMKEAHLPHPDINYSKIQARVSGFDEAPSIGGGQHYQDVRVVPEDTCLEAWKDRYSAKDRICDNFSYSSNDLYDHCYDIRGSGLIYNNTVIGVASIVDNCKNGRGRSVAVYTKVQHFNNWIQEVRKINSA